MISTCSRSAPAPAASPARAAPAAMARGSRSARKAGSAAPACMRGCVPKKLLVYGAQFADAFADAAGFGWNVPPPSFDWPSLIAAKNKELDRLEQIYSDDAEERQSRADRRARHRHRPAYGRGRRPHLHRRQHHDRDRRPSDAARHPRHRACDLVERGARSAEPAAAHRHRRRRLYRGRVRRHLQRVRIGGRRDHPARGFALRL